MDGNSFHYESCGLPNIWLRNGFVVRESAYGEAVSVHNLEGLHRAIGLSLVLSKPTLTGAEVRFLRKEMDMPQVQLAHLLDVSESAVRNWESPDRNDISGPAERMLRALYLEYAKEGSEIRKLLERLSQLNRDIHAVDLVEFAETEGVWQTAA